MKRNCVGKKRKKKMGKEKEVGKEKGMHQLMHPLSLKV